MICLTSDTAAPDARHPVFRAGRRRPGILVVNELGLTLTLLKLELEGHGFAVWLAGNGLEAIAAYRQDHDAIDLVLLEVKLPGLDGLQTLAALQGIDPELLVCFMNRRGAYTEDDLIRRGAACVFNEQCRTNDIAEFLHRLVDNPGFSRLPIQLKRLASGNLQ